MTVSCPQIYGYSIENMKQKILYLREIGLEEIVINDSKKLIQSVDLIYARYEYLTKDKDIKITYQNYRKLFQNAKQFEKQYNISKSELLQKYPYHVESEKYYVRTI